MLMCTALKKEIENTDIYIVDTFGDTQHFINIICILGGSYIKRIGQNPLKLQSFENIAWSKYG